MKSKLLAFFLLYSFFIYSQKYPNIYDFFGGKTFDNKAVFFRLVFQINNSQVNGYMYTDEQGSSETKSAIKGTYNKKTKLLSFVETRKLLSKSNYGFNDMCYVDAQLLLELNPEISKLNGLFIEKTLTNKKCNKGSIKLISADAYNRLKTEIAKPKVKKKSIIKIKDSTTLKKLELPQFNSNKKTTIKDDEEIIVYWESDSIKLTIWDALKEDGDRITISFNNEIIIDNYELKNEPKKIEIKLTQNENILTFTANNTGYIANNTARVDLFDNKLKHQIITELQLNKSVNVIIKKQLKK